MVLTKNTLGAKATRMLNYINHIIRVELIDGYLCCRISVMNRRSFVGQFLAYDAHMNIVLVHAKEVITKGIKKDLPPLPSRKMRHMVDGCRSSWRGHYRRKVSRTGVDPGSKCDFRPYMWSSSLQYGTLLLLSLTE